MYYIYTTQITGLLQAGITEGLQQAYMFHQFAF